MLNKVAEKLIEYPILKQLPAKQREFLLQELLNLPLSQGREKATLQKTEQSYSFMPEALREFQEGWVCKA